MAEEVTATRRAQYTFTRDHAEIGRARRAVAATLRTWGVGVDRMAMELVASELITNAVRHGRGAVGVALSVADSRLRIEVHDEGGGEPTRRAVAPDDVPAGGGWGLNFVDELVDDWGTDTDGGTTVWVETAVTDRP